MLALEIPLIVVLLLVNAFLAASEISIVSARKPLLRSLADEGSLAAARVLRLNEEPSGFLATVQVGITLAGFFASAVGAVSLAGVVGGSLEEIGLSSGNARSIGLVLVTIVLSFLSIVVGELVPKTIAVQRAERIAMLVARPIEILATVTRPAVALLTGTTNLILRLLGSGRRAVMPSVTREELLAMLETAEDEGVVEAADADLIEEAFEFGGTVVRSIMVPRVGIAALSAETSLAEAAEVFDATGFSRLPIYGQSIDDILGVLHIKDVFRLLRQAEGESLIARAVLRPAYFVPDSKPIDALLKELRTRRTQLAIVVDEFGGTAGLVTLEDVIEELVGEIADEFDPGYEPMRQLSPGVIEADGRVAVADLLDRFDLDRDLLAGYGGETIGGLLVNALGRFPREGEVLTAGPLRLRVVAMDEHRVQQVVVEFSPEAELGV